MLVRHGYGLADTSLGYGQGMIWDWTVWRHGQSMVGIRLTVHDICMGFGFNYPSLASSDGTLAALLQCGGRHVNQRNIAQIRSRHFLYLQ